MPVGQPQECGTRAPFAQRSGAARTPQRANRAPLGRCWKHMYKNEPGRDDDRSGTVAWLKPHPWKMGAAAEESCATLRAMGRQDSTSQRSDLDDAPRAGPRMCGQTHPAHALGSPLQRATPRNPLRRQPLQRRHLPRRRPQDTAIAKRLGPGRTPGPLRPRSQASTCFRPKTGRGIQR